MSLIKSGKQLKTENLIESKRGAIVKMMKPVTTLASVTSCISVGFLIRQWRACSDGDEGGGVENVS